MFLVIQDFRPSQASGSVTGSGLPETQGNFIMINFSTGTPASFRSLSLAAIFVVACCAQVNAADTIQINVSDASGQPVACRIHLANDKGEP